MQYVACYSKDLIPRFGDAHNPQPEGETKMNSKDVQIECQRLLVSSVTQFAASMNIQLEPTGSRFFGNVSTTSDYGNVSTTSDYDFFVVQGPNNLDSFIGCLMKLGFRIEIYPGMENVQEVLRHPYGFDIMIVTPGWFNAFIKTQEYLKRYHLDVFCRQNKTKRKKIFGEIARMFYMGLDSFLSKT